jgi:SAM-dependent methyltransferase
MVWSTSISLQDYLAPDAQVIFRERGISESPIPNPSPGLLANRDFFGHPQWAKTYFDMCHRHEAFKQRWLAAGGSWDHKIVVDIGCGPGNLYATLQGSPRLLIGVDVSRGALEMAQQLGYTPLLADAHRLPFIPGFADIVAVNATLHHCDDMARVLAQSARLVRPGGLLIVDHDPQLTAWDYRGLALFCYKIRLRIYWVFLRSLHTPREERLKALATELHHKPGDGVTAELFLQTLNPLDFTVRLFPHNQTVGAEALTGHMGRPPHWRYRVGQRLSGINPHSPDAALSIMCVAIRN